MIEQSFTLTVTVSVNLIYPHFLIPTGDGEMFRCGTEADGGDAIFRRVRDLDILTEISLSWIRRARGVVGGSEEAAGHIDFIAGEIGG